LAKTVLLGVIFTALFAVGMFSAVFAVNPDQFLIISASTDGVTLTMTVAEKIKQIPAKDADSLLTFYGWGTLFDDERGFVADTITIHHGVNDHQAFGKDAQSSPVQGYHPHVMTFGVAGCLLDIVSPKADFRVQGNTVTLESDDSFEFAVTGRADLRPECPTGLGIIDIYDTSPPDA